VVYHKVWKPSPGDPVDIDQTVEKELKDLYNKFNVASVVYDPTHLLPTMMRLSQKGIPTRSFEQTSGNMTAASQLMFELFKNRNLEAYPDDELRRQIQMAVAESNSRGFRIVRAKVSKRHHIDAAIALAMACYEAVTNGGVDTSIPLIIRSPYSDATAIIDAEQLMLPPELRT
jgi:phage terminase large subunit-like protein